MSNKIAFSNSHEWVSIQGNIAVVGITQYAREELGEIVAVILPLVGTTIHAGDEVCVLESTKAAADVYTPLSGKIVKVNVNLIHDPKLINTAPESTGWLFQIEGFNPKEFEKLLSLAAYQDYIQK